MSYIYEYIIPQLRTELGSVRVTPYRLHFKQSFYGHTQGAVWLLNHKALPLLPEEKLQIFSDGGSLIIAPVSWQCGDGVQGEVFWGNIAINIAPVLPPFATTSGHFLDFLICHKV